MRFKKSLQEPGARRTTVWHHHGSDTPTSARAILHHTDQNGPNILKGSVDSENLSKNYTQLTKMFREEFSFVFGLHGRIKSDFFV